MTFRIGLGSSSCRQRELPDPFLSEVCRELLRRLDAIALRVASELETIPIEWHEEATVRGRSVSFSLHKKILDSGDTLVVMQSFAPSWRWPTYFSVKAIGHVFAEGLLVSSQGNVRSAEDKLLWAYR